MITLENKPTSIEVKDETGKLVKTADYGYFIDMVCIAPPSNGFALTDIEHRLSIRKAVKKSDGTINLEDADVKYLKGLVKTARFPIAHEDILGFVKYVESI